MSEPRVWDCIMYAGESDMLEMRLNELNGRVHRHVIAEAEVTHRGIPKPLWFPAERERFAQWDDRITYVVAKELPVGPDNWRREHIQRDAARAGLHDAADDDLVLISDADELPSAATLAWRGDKAAALMMTTCHSAVDLVYREPQYAGVIARWGWAKDRPLGEVRDGRYGYPIIYFAGFHFSWVGSQAYRQAKLDYSTCHVEMPGAEWEAIRSGATYERGEHHAPDTDVIAVDVNAGWPKWIRERRCPPEWYRPREAP